MNKRGGMEEIRGKEENKLEKDKRAEWRRGHVYSTISKWISIGQNLISDNLNIFLLDWTKDLKHISF